MPYGQSTEMIDDEMLSLLLEKIRDVCVSEREGGREGGSELIYQCLLY